MPTLSSLLVQRNVASMQAVEDAIARQVIYGDDLATNVLEVGAAREDDVMRLAAESMGLFPLPTGKIVLLDPAVLRLLTGDVAQRYGIFPIEKRGSDLVVATSEPLSQNVEEDLGFLLNLNLRPVYALHVRIVQALADHYGVAVERRYKRLLDKLEGRRAHETEPPGAPSGGIGATGLGAIGHPGLPSGVRPPGRAHTIPMAFAPAPPAPSVTALRSEAQRPASPTTSARTAESEDAPSTGALPPDRPTLRGLPAVKADADEPWGPAPDHAASGLPATIDLSPRPPKVTEEPAKKAPSVPPAATSARAPSAPPAATSAQTTSAQAAPAKTATDRPEAASKPPAASVPAALQMRAVARETRPTPARARRKGPFPASLAEEEMQSAVTTDAVLEVFFAFAQQYFEYAALFVVHGDIAEGRDAAGRGADRSRVSAVGIPLDLPSTLAAARDRRVPVIADLAHDGLDAELLHDLGRAAASDGGPVAPTAPPRRAPAAVIPIVVRGRAVALLFGDDAPAPVELPTIGEVIAFAALAGASIERIILRKKMGRSAGTTRLSSAAASAVAPRPEAGAKPKASEASAPRPSARPLPATARPGVAALARMFAPAAPAPEKRKDETADVAPAPSAAGRPEGEAAARPVEEAAPHVADAIAEPVEEAAPHVADAIAEPVEEAAPHAADAIAEPVEEAAPVIVAPVKDEHDEDAERALIEHVAETPGDAVSIAIALQTPSLSDAVTAVPVAAAPRLDTAEPAIASPEPLPVSPEPDADHEESSSDALTVALFVHASTPAPTVASAYVEEVAPEADERPAHENETQIVPDHELETVLPGSVAIADAAEAEADESLAITAAPGESLALASAPEARGDESGASVEEISVPIDIEPSVPIDVEPSVPIDGEPSAQVRVETSIPAGSAPIASGEAEAEAAEPGAPAQDEASGDRPSSADRPSSFDRPASSDGRPSAPIVVDVFADSTEGLASAIARAAEEANARAALRASRRVTPVPSPESSEPGTSNAALRSLAIPTGISMPPETLTEGFPAVAPLGSHLSIEPPSDLAPAIGEASVRMSVPAADGVLDELTADATSLSSAAEIDAADAMSDEASPSFVDEESADRTILGAAVTFPDEPSNADDAPIIAVPDRAANLAAPPAGAPDLAQEPSSPPNATALFTSEDFSDVSIVQASPLDEPTTDERTSPWTALPLDALLQRAARGADVVDARLELLRRAERNLAPLLALFPGPLEQDRHRSADRLPPASQCGPLLEAFARSGPRGAATVAVLARHDDVDVRFWAAHLLGEIESAEAAEGLLAFLVDPDAAVRRIALRSASQLLAASLPGRPLEAALGYLARDAQTSMRERIAAIDAMGQLRLPFFVPVLIGLLGAVPDEVGETARRALLVLTRQDFGRDAARWTEWWARNDARHRIEWLIDALMHETQSIRRAAGDELKAITKEYFGYYDDLPRRERERAQERYREWWERDGRARFS